MSQHHEISVPFPASVIEKKPGSFDADYIPHGMITQRLLATLGPFDQRVVRELYDDLPTSEYVEDPNTGQSDFIEGMRSNILTGVVLELTVFIDEVRVVVQEAGDVENPLKMKTNGARLKVATSDALKRCAMRLGCGLHLWSKPYVLDRKLLRVLQSDEEE